MDKGWIDKKKISLQDLTFQTDLDRIKDLFTDFVKSLDLAFQTDHDTIQLKDLVKFQI